MNSWKDESLLKTYINKQRLFSMSRKASSRIPKSCDDPSLPDRICDCFQELESIASLTSSQVKTLSYFRSRLQQYKHFSSGSQIEGAFECLNPFANKFSGFRQKMRNA